MGPAIVFLFWLIAGIVMAATLGLAYFMLRRVFKRPILAPSNHLKVLGAFFLLALFPVTAVSLLILSMNVPFPPTIEWRLTFGNSVPKAVHNLEANKSFGSDFYWREFRFESSANDVVLIADVIGLEFDTVLEPDPRSDTDFFWKWELKLERPCSKAEKFVPVEANGEHVFDDVALFFCPATDEVRIFMSDID